MATAPHRPLTRTVDYPTTDGKPMAETETHRDDMMDLIQSLQDYFTLEPLVCVSGNMLMYYEEGNRRKHVSPDVFVVRGIEKKKRDNYLIWEEGKAPDLVIELTSKSTKREDEQKKRVLYRDVLKVAEYFLFDPTEDYLNPPLQGFRLTNGEYSRIEPLDGRLPSEVLGLHLERDGEELRLYDPKRQFRLLTRSERASEAEQRAETAEQRAETAKQRAQLAEQRAEESEALVRQQTAEIERFQREFEALRRRLDPGQ
jgi:Uma2 family endonuclease